MSLNNFSLISFSKSKNEKCIKMFSTFLGLFMYLFSPFFTLIIKIQGWALTR